MKFFKFPFSDWMERKDPTSEKSLWHKSTMMRYHAGKRDIWPRYDGWSPRPWRGSKAPLPLERRRGWRTHLTKRQPPHDSKIMLETLRCAGQIYLHPALFIPPPMQKAHTQSINLSK